MMGQVVKESFSIPYYDTLCDGTAVKNWFRDKSFWVLILRYVFIKRLNFRLVLS